MGEVLILIKASKGLSLNDCYWVVEEGFEGTYDKYNLYNNRFSQVLDALIMNTNRHFGNFGFIIDNKNTSKGKKLITAI